MDTGVEGMLSRAPVGNQILGGRWYTLPLPFVMNQPSHFRNYPSSPGQGEGTASSSPLA